MNLPFDQIILVVVVSVLIVVVGLIASVSLPFRTNCKKTLLSGSLPFTFTYRHTLSIIRNRSQDETAAIKDDCYDPM